MKHRYELLSRRMRERMDKENLSVRDLSTYIQSTYANTRSLVQGRRRIPERAARLIC